MARRRKQVEFVTGVAEIDARLKELPAKVNKKIFRRAARQVAKSVADLAKSYVPVDTGELEDSIKVRAVGRPQSRRGKIGARVVTSDAASGSLFTGDTFYGGFVEFGTRKMESIPFMRPAMEHSRPRVRSDFAKLVRKIIEEEDRKAKT